MSRAILRSPLPSDQSRFRLSTTANRPSKQVVVAGTGGRAFEQSRDVLSGGQRWTVSDFETKKTVIKAGLGWGGMPEHMITAEVDRGELIVLNVEGFPPRHTEIFAIRRRDQAMGRVMSDIWAALQD